MVTNIFSRWELFLDRQLIETLDGLTLQLQRPIPREIAVSMDCPWEDEGSGVYNTVLKDGDEYRLYYRASQIFKDPVSPNDQSSMQYTCVAVSSDGIHWKKPELGIIEIDGSTRNNAVLSGFKAHNFTPFIDTNPACPASQRYKGTGLQDDGIIGLVSPDGLHWQQISEKAILTDGEFDSQNPVFYDNLAGKYRCYSRYYYPKKAKDTKNWNGVRAIQHAESDDFLHWGEQIENEYTPEYPREHFYTNATTPCPGAEHYLISIPMRFAEHRKKVPAHKGPGVSDGVLLSSRDGTLFSREFPEAFIRPAIGDDNWTQRCHITATGILETAPDEFSIYVGEHYCHENACIRRYTLRRHGFAALHGDYIGGSMTTKPLTFEGHELHLNYATSAFGSVKVEILRESGEIWASEEIYGNEIEACVNFGDKEVASLEGETIRLRFTLQDADVFAYRFA